MVCDLTQYLPTGVSTVRIRLRRTFPLLGRWYAILALGHSGVTAWSGESGVSCHYRDHPGTKKKKKMKVAAGYNILFFENLKSNQFTRFKHKKGKTTCRLATNVFSLLITVAKLISSLYVKREAWFYEAGILSFSLNFNSQRVM